MWRWLLRFFRRSQRAAVVSYAEPERYLVFTGRREGSIAPVQWVMVSDRKDGQSKDYLVWLN